MRPFRGLVWGCALLALTAGGGTAQAAWNNVFQVCCNSCRSSTPAAPVVAAYGSDPCPQPQTNCTTRYIQRSYYQPVTSYKTTTYYEPVTTYRTSYYYEPVNTYRYSCYFDPCTCSYQKVAIPVTSYQLRSRCCPVTSYLQRTCMTPVTTYQQSFYYEPVTTCCTTTTGAPVASPPAGASVTPAAPSTPPAPPSVTPSTTYEPPPTPYPAGPTPAPPSTEENRTPGTASDSMKFNRNPRYPNAIPPVDSAYRQPQIRPTSPPAVRPTPATPPLTPRADRIASLSQHTVEGHVVNPDRTPRTGARVLLVSAEKSGQRQVVTTDGAGQFRANLASGAWLVYVHDASGKPVFSRRVEVQDKQIQQVTLIER